MTEIKRSKKVIPKYQNKTEGDLNEKVLFRSLGNMQAIGAYILYNTSRFAIKKKTLHKE